MDYGSDIETYVMRRLKDTPEEEQTNIDAGLNDILKLIEMDLDSINALAIPTDALKSYNILLGQLDAVNALGIHNTHDVLTLGDEVYESLRNILGDLREDYIQHCKKEKTDPNEEYLKTFTVERDEFDTYIADIHNEIKEDRRKEMTKLNVTRAAMVSSTVIIDEFANINIKKGTYEIKPISAPLTRYMFQKTEVISTDNTFTQGYPCEASMIKHMFDMQARQIIKDIIKQDSTDITL